MAETLDIDRDAAVARRRGIAADLRLIAALHDREPTRELLTELKAVPASGWLAVPPERDPALKGLRLMRGFLEPIAGDADAALLDALAVDFGDIYLTFAFRASATESPWFDDEGLERQAAMFAVREFYRRHGLAAADWRKRPDDHLVTQLEFIAHLVETDPGGAGLAETAAFLDDHLLRWVPAFAQRVSERCATGFYAGAALLTQGYLEELRELIAGLGIERRQPDVGPVGRGCSAAAAPVCRRGG